MAKGLGLSNGLVQLQLSKVRVGWTWTWVECTLATCIPGENRPGAAKPEICREVLRAFRLLVARCGTPVLKVIPITAYHKKNTIRFNMPICREITSCFRRFLDVLGLWTNVNHMDHNLTLWTKLGSAGIEVFSCACIQESIQGCPW